MTRTTTTIFLLVLIAGAASANEFLGNYSLQFQRCDYLQSYDEELAQGTSSVMATEWFASFRLCPVSAEDCNSNYGEYLVDLKTYLGQAVNHYQGLQHDMCSGCKECGTNSDASATVDCDTCYDECQNMERMEENGFIDATNFLECSMIYDPKDESMGRLYAGPVCAGSGKRIKIGVFTDKNCYNVDPSKDVEDYLMDGNGYPLKLSHALLKQTYKEGMSISCSATGQDDTVPELCQDLYQSAAKCETSHGMTDGMQQSPDRFYNQLQQEDTVCDFIQTLKDGTYQEALLAQQPEPHVEQVLQQRLDPLHRQMQFITEANPLPWLSQYSLGFRTCQHFPQWNWHARSDDNVRLATRRMAHYQLCPNREGPGTCPTANEQCGNYVLDLNEFLEEYFEAQRQSHAFDCDYLDSTVCSACPHEDSNCWKQCYRLHGMDEICSNSTSTTADTRDFFSVSSQPSMVPHNMFCLRDASSSNPPLYIGPYCNGQQVRLAYFTDDTCTIFFPESKPATSNHGLIYRDQNLIQKGCVACTTRHGNGGNCELAYRMSGKCEKGMSARHEHVNNACDYIQSSNPSPPPNMKEPLHEDEKAVAKEEREAGTPWSSAAVSIGLSTAVMMGLAAVALLA